MKTLLPRFVDVEPPALPLVVAGDIHLSLSHPDVRERFIAFIGARAEVGGTLLLLGDVFDYWIGRPQAKEPFLRPVFEALRVAGAAGLELIFQAGNRDFLFDGAEALSLAFWPEVVRTELCGRRVIFTHGDLLCTADRSYLRLRRFIRRPGGAPRLWPRAFPYAVARYIALGSRRLSERETRRKPRAYTGIDYGAAARWLDAGEADVLVAGHVHTGVHHVLAASDDTGRSREILVLRDWERGGGVVLVDAQGIRLVPPA